jgi:hypothetical protein
VPRWFVLDTVCASVSAAPVTQLVVNASAELAKRIQVLREGITERERVVRLMRSRPYLLCDQGANTITALVDVAYRV